MNVDLGSRERFDSDGEDPSMVSADRARSRTFVVTGAASGIGLATAQAPVGRRLRRLLH